LKKGDRTVVEISRLAGLGDGMAMVNGKKIFIAKTVPGDRVEIEVTYVGKEDARGEIISIVQAGNERRVPPCSHYMLCGGCSLQQLNDVAYRNFKQQMVVEAIRKAGFDPVLMREVIFILHATRRRTTLSWDGKYLGYRAARSHMVIDITHCPVLAPQLESCISSLREVLKEIGSAINSIHLTLLDDGIDALFISSSGLQTSQEMLLAKFAENNEVIRVSHAQESNSPKIIIQKGAAIIHMESISIPVPPGIFLQASVEAQHALVKAVKENISTGNVLDLYCGIGTYSIPLALAGCTVTAVEGDAQMTEPLRVAARTNKLPIKIFARDLVKHPFALDELNRFDAVVINPPRVGAKLQAEKLAQSKVKKIIMVSCNPATFTRDAAILRAGGYTLMYAKAVDQFIWSSHLELIAVFTKK